MLTWVGWLYLAVPWGVVLDAWSRRIGGWTIAPRMPAALVVEDTAFRNGRKPSDRENARIEPDRALGRVMMGT